jgi:peptide/nickel transport system permease protein
MKKVSAITRHISVFILSLYICAALLSPWLAQSYPIIYKKNGTWHQALFTPSKVSFLEVEGYILPLIPFSPQKTHLKDAHLPPLSFSESLPENRHWLGTDKLGRDILSGLIHGSSISLTIGFLSVWLSMLLGVPLGILASFYGNSGIRLNIYQWFYLLLAGFLSGFYLFAEWHHLSTSQVIVYITCALTLWIVGNHFLKRIGTKLRMSFPLDTLVIKTAELRKSFPGLFILLALTTLFAKTSVYNVVIIIVLLSWMEFARYARAESLSVIHTPYIESSRLMGFKDMYIIWKHILPQISPVLVVLGSYGVSNAILLESSLSFLGIGLPTEVVTWGKMLADGRDIQYPWMVIFPGMAIFVLIGVLHKWADLYK